MQRLPRKANKICRRTSWVHICAWSNREMLFVDCCLWLPTYVRQVTFSLEELPMLLHRDSWTRTCEYSSREHQLHRIRLSDTWVCVGLVPQEPILPSEMELEAVV